MNQTLLLATTIDITDSIQVEETVRWPRYLYYSQTKVDAELALIQELNRYIIVRTAWLYGRRGPNFLKTMLRQALRTPTTRIKVVNDQFGSLTWSYRLAAQLAKIIAVGGRSMYHATMAGYATWFEVASYFLTEFGITTPIQPCCPDRGHG